MKSTLYGLRVLAVMVLASAVFPSLHAQDSAVKFDDKLEIEFGAPPDLAASALPRAKKTKNWMVINFTYESFPYEGSDYLDEITFKVYIEGRQKKDTRDREGDPIVLTGEVTYINIPAGRDQYGVVFVHYDAVERYMIETKSTQLNVRVEAYEKGKLADQVEKNSREENDKWVSAYPGKSGLVLNQSQTPWACSGSAAFPQIKLEGAK